MGLSKCCSSRTCLVDGRFRHRSVGGFCPEAGHAVLAPFANCVLGGVSFLLFGLISGNGLSLLVDAKVDCNERCAIS